MDEGLVEGFGLFEVTDVPGPRDAGERGVRNACLHGQRDAGRVDRIQVAGDQVNRAGQVFKAITPVLQGRGVQGVQVIVHTQAVNRLGHDLQDVLGGAGGHHAQRLLVAEVCWKLVVFDDTAAGLNKSLELGGFQMVKTRAGIGQRQ